MKKLMLIAALWLVSVGFIFAQGRFGIEKNKRLKREEVPAVVQSALQIEFNIPAEEGSWSLRYLESSGGVGKPALLTPVAYTFNEKKDGNKIEVRFSPTGILQHAKGVERAKEGHSSGS